MWTFFKLKNTNIKRRQDKILLQTRRFVLTFIELSSEVNILHAKLWFNISRVIAVLIYNIRNITNCFWIIRPWVLFFYYSPIYNKKRVLINFNFFTEELLKLFVILFKNWIPCRRLVPTLHWKNSCIFRWIYPDGEIIFFSFFAYDTGCSKNSPRAEKSKVGN